jgi:hypothetical protein
LGLPDVEDVTSPRGFGFKARGKLLACQAIHGSAEPDTLMVRVSMTERALSSLRNRTCTTLRSTIRSTPPCSCGCSA